MGDLQGFDFTGALFPAVGDVAAVDWFAAATLQQFGFWYEHDGEWRGSMVASIDGVSRKGSDYLWAAYLRQHLADPAVLTATGQSSLTPEAWHAIAADDDGRDPFPDVALCVDLANDYGRSLAAIGCAATELVAAAAATERPMRPL